jgi:hydrogenase maturation protein HypF
VGFRPFIFQLAETHGILGTVSNTVRGVEIRAQGDPDQVAAFLLEIPAAAPPLSHITEITVEEAAISPYFAFTIEKSDPGERMETLIPPDVSVCDQCLEELFDPADRRHRYPFINCTNCGPRYTIITDIPYDRPKTSMAAFPMCPDCRREYEDPKNRRFHAQPNACPVCGPRVVLCGPGGDPIAEAAAVEKTAALLQSGAIVAVKGLGGFHLACDATHAAAVDRLRSRKRREEKPFALMAPDLPAVGRFARVLPQEAAMLTGNRRPIVLVQKRADHPIADSVAPGTRCFGVMLPYTPLHALLMESGFTALVMTSANLRDEPIAAANNEAFSRLSEIADYFLIHDRDIVQRCDDSVVRVIADEPRFYRRSRGYVPHPVFLAKRYPVTLALGADLKNTQCLLKGDQAFLSRHVGDMETLEAHRFFKETGEHLEKILAVRPEIIAVDAHPGYYSTKAADDFSPLPVVPVFHHHAHIVSVTAEHQFTGPVIGLSFDGTGYGEDGTIWGGEFLFVEGAAFTRSAHLDPVPLPGGDAAVRAPWRTAIAYLNHAFGGEMQRRTLPFLSHIEDEALSIVTRMVRKQINAPVTSSLGRLFDAVAAIAGVRSTIRYEGQAAVELTARSDDSETGDRYEIAFFGEGPVIIDHRPLIRGVAADVERGISVFEIGGRFHRALVHFFTELTRRISHSTGVRTVALSGGVFQNEILLGGLIKSLGAAGFTVLANKQVPANDGGISLGQAVIAAEKMQSG